MRVFLLLHDERRERGGRSVADRERDVEKTIEKIGAENLVRGCSFARRKNGGDDGGGGGNTGKKDEEEEKENGTLWRVLKLIADVGKGRKYEKNQ